MIDSSEIHVLDANAAYFGVPSQVLMENAGKAVAEFIKRSGDAQHVLVLCGKGNNGGDGFVAARYLAADLPVTVFITSDSDTIRSQTARDNYAKLADLDIPVYNIKDKEKLDQLLESHDTIVDAMLGIGVSGRLRPPYDSLVKKLNDLKGKTIISVDITTGLGTSLSVKPQYTITFHAAKTGMTKQNCGRIHVVDIGIPQQAEEYVGPGELMMYYPRSSTQSHKGDNGVVLVIGGGPYVGAPALTGLAALRTGADLVFVATPRRSWELVASYSADLIVKDLTADVLVPADVPAIKKLLSRATAVVLGPGLGDDARTSKAIVDILKLVVAEKIPLVVDADGFKPLGDHLDVLKKIPVVLTPHAGEFQLISNKRLPDEVSARKNIVASWAKACQVTVLLKGPVDIITNGAQTKFNEVHNPAMTVGGTGDVLAGITGALLAKKVSPFNAARIAAFVNGTAGNQAQDKYSYGMVASDMIAEIPLVLKKYL